MFGTNAPQNGLLRVELLESRGLKKEDALGKDDAFVELWLNKDFKQKSKTIKDSNKPDWCQTFDFSVEKGSSDHKLYYVVLDKDTFGADKIGEGHIAIDSAYKGENIDTWGKLPVFLGFNHGELHFKVSFIPQN